MHVGGLFEFTKPPDAGPDFLAATLARMRQERAVPPPWNLRVVDGGPLVGARLPVMREVKDVDLDYHVRHSALPHPGSQRELGILVSRLHSNQLDLHKPLWEIHLIEGLERNRFAIYMKMHHSLIDGVSGIRLILRTLSTDPEERGMGAFWTVGAGSRPGRPARSGGGPLDAIFGAALGGAEAAIALGRAGVELGRASLDDGALSSPYTAPASALGGHLEGQRRFATQQYDLAHLKRLAVAADCTLNDIVLYLSSAALRRYLGEHGTIPERPLTAGIPVNLREADDESTGTAVGMLVADLGTNIADPLERIATIKASTAEAKRHQSELPAAARAPYTLLLNGPYIAGLIAGLGGSAPAPFSLAISNVPGPTETLYFNGAKLDALFPLSLLLHGNALNITCLSYAGTLNFGFTGARDTLPHLQRLALYMGDSLEEITETLLPKRKRRRRAKAGSTKRGKGASAKGRKAAPKARSGGAKGRKASGSKTKT
jgi:diacylglycerol O-acyltransferase / wax synthase